MGYEPAETTARCLPSDAAATPLPLAIATPASSSVYPKGKLEQSAAGQQLA